MTLSNNKILSKVIKGNSSKENAQSVVDWFASTIEGQQTLSDMIDKDAYLMEDISAKDNQMGSAQSEQLLKKIEKEIRVKRIKRLGLKSAAIIIPFFILLGITIYTNVINEFANKSEYTEIYIPKGEKARVFFQDGTEAYLNADTKIIFPKKFSSKERIIQLYGEAYFNVASDEKHPFIVETSNCNIKVLGTSFNVKAYDEDQTTDITLDEGSIIFNSTHSSHEIKPGQQIIYNNDRQDYSIINLNSSSDFSLWTSDIIHFDDTPLEDVIKVLERLFDINFSIKDNKALNYSFTITTRRQDIESVLKELEKISPIRFTLSNHAYEVKLKPYF